MAYIDTVALESLLMYALVLNELLRSTGFIAHYYYYYYYYYIGRLEVFLLRQYGTRKPEDELLKSKHVVLRPFVMTVKIIFIDNNKNRLLCNMTYASIYFFKLDLS
jgi:hypothetical protein